MLDALARDFEGNEGDDLNRLMCSDAQGAIGVGMPGGVAMRRLHDSDHQYKRDADHPDERYPGRSRAQL